jgi:flagellar basal body P-ring protein FlgI
VGAASVSHGGLTLTIGDPSVGTRAGTAAAAGTPDSSRAPPPTGVVRASAGASVQEIAAALQVSGARPRDVAAFFEALSIVGALRATVVVR